MQSFVNVFDLKRFQYINVSCLNYFSWSIDEILINVMYFRFFLFLNMSVKFKFTLLTFPSDSRQGIYDDVLLFAVISRN